MCIRDSHIVEGFIKAINILDEVIATIRSSKSKKDAGINLVTKFGFTEEQAEAILELMLYRLTGLEITVFQKEYAELEKKISKLKKILASEKELLKVVKTELKEITDKYRKPRRTMAVSYTHLDVYKRQGQVWRLITCAFLHEGLVHIFFNMYALKILGPEIQYVYGKIKYLIIYLLSAIAASIFSYIFGPQSVSVGASGAI